MKASVVVAGHLCLDIIPAFLASAARIAPGSLTEVGPVTLATGGGVSNVGLSLLRLGIPAKLMGKVGDDAFGEIVRRLLGARGADAARAVVTAPGESTSYTIVINMPGVDRSFLHHAGCNDSFSAEDVDLSVLTDAAIFYLGYPPLMRRFYEDEGRQLAALLAKVKEGDVATALDMAMPDPAADSGRVNWRAFLQRVLPHVDIFTPSCDETLFMLERQRFKAHASGERGEGLALERSLADTLIAMGAAVVGLTLGERGLYLRTAGEARLEQVGSRLALPAAGWANRELWAPVFKVEAKGTTGSGDTTMAGFLASLLHGLDPENALTMAVAVGACSVEAPDSTSGVRSWDETRARVQAGWEQESTATAWPRASTSGVYVGPHDQGGFTT